MTSFLGAIEMAGGGPGGGGGGGGAVVGGGGGPAGMGAADPLDSPGSLYEIAMVSHTTLDSFMMSLRF